jgi:hypothetical protein
MSAFDPKASVRISCPTVGLLCHPIGWLIRIVTIVGIGAHALVRVGGDLATFAGRPLVQRRRVSANIGNIGRGEQDGAAGAGAE